MSTLPDSQKALILMTSLTPETVACLFREMNQEVAESLSVSFHRSSAVSAPVQAEVVQEFLRNVTREVGPVRDLDDLEQLAQDHPRVVIKVLRRTWPGLYRGVMNRRSRVLRTTSKLP